MPGQHSLLSPSAAKRWLHCTPSAVLESKVPEQESPYAAEGTLAHAIAERLLRCYSEVGRTTIIEHIADVWRAQPLDPWAKSLKDQADAMDLDFWEMLDQVNNDYCEFVLTAWADAQVIDPDAALLVEQRVDISGYVPDCSGTADCVIVGDGVLHIIDLKWGKGVKVNAQANPQLELYALGVMDGCGKTYTSDMVKMTICQPRLHHISTYEIKRANLMIWAESYVRARAEQAAQGRGLQQAGSWCQFCKVAGSCSTLKSLATHFAFKGSYELDEEGLSTALDVAPTIQTWLDRINDLALRRLLDGQTIPDYKLVEGRSLRRISDADKAVEHLHGLGYQDEDIYKPRELKTIGDLEKMVGKKQFGALFADCVIKPTGKPTVVHDSDPRPAMTAAEFAFKE